MIDVVLVAPQIASNTGAIIRVCANVGARLHLVEPFGFSLDAAAVRRGGLDYHELTEVRRWPDLDACRAALGADRRWWATSARGSVTYDRAGIAPGDVVTFGCEATGLPDDVLASFPAERVVRIPMRAGSRSLNLANAVAVVAYEAWRARGFEGAAEGAGATTVERFPARREPGT